MSEIDGLNVTEAAAYLKLHRSTVSRLVARNAIPHRMIGRAPRFSKQALSRWLAGDAPAAVAASPTRAPTAARPRLTPKHIGRRGATVPAGGGAATALGVVRGGRT